MKQKCKRVLCLLLTLLLLMGCSSAALAADSCACGTAPLIVVTGMNAWPLVLNAGTDQEKQVFAPDTQAILKLVGQIAGPVAQFAVTKDYDKLGDDVLPAVYALFEPLACNPDGGSRYAVTTTVYPESMANYPEFVNEEGYLTNEPALVRAAAQKIGADHVYYFNYDWRLDPMEHAKELRAYVERAKQETGHDKVNLVGSSMGGTIIASYLAQYGSGDIDTFTMLSSAFTGTTIVGDLFTGKIEFHKEALIRILKEVAGQQAVNVLLDALDQAGIIDVLLPVLDELVAHLKDRVYDEVFQDTFVTMPGIWDLIALEDYEDAKAYLLDPEEDAQLIARIDAYHYQVQEKLPELFRAAMEQGTKINVVSHYNLQGVPLTPSYREQNDNVIDTKYTSGYATCALLDETLPEGYQQKNTNCRDASHHHISGDRMIDASTCLMPEQTWFLKDLKHVGYIYDTQVMEFILWLCLSDSQRTVQEAGDYSQFMQVDPETGALSLIQAGQPEEPDTQEPATAELKAPETAPGETLSEEPVSPLTPPESTVRQQEEPAGAIADTGRAGVRPASLGPGGRCSRGIDAHEEKAYNIKRKNHDCQAAANYCAAA